MAFVGFDDNKTPNRGIDRLLEFSVYGVRPEGVILASVIDISISKRPRLEVWEVLGIVS